MGADILKMNGSVADAAITTMLCEGITCELKLFSEGGTSGFKLI